MKTKCQKVAGLYNAERAPYPSHEPPETLKRGEIIRLAAVDEPNDKDAEWSRLSLPSKLYRFRTVDRAKEVLKTNNLYFSSPSAFNDPFDCHITPLFGKSPRQREEFARQLARRNHPEKPRRDRIAMVKKARKRGDLESSALMRIFEDWKKKFVDNCGILCLVTRPDNILMWSHYAEGHTGVCFEFQFKLAEFGITASHRLPGLLTPVLALPVFYEEKFPNFDFVEFYSKRGGSAEQSALLRFAETVFLTKAMAWKYEQEYRIIDFPPALGTRMYGLRPFSPTCLTGIIFGCQIKEQTKEEITTLAAARQPRPRLYQAKVKPREFALEIVDLPF
jgi:hypothetical protein